jgi:hypothetical protein
VTRVNLWISKKKKKKKIFFIVSVAYHIVLCFGVATVVFGSTRGTERTLDGL